MLAGIDEALNRAQIARMLPNAATGEKIKFKTHNEYTAVP